MRRAALPLLSLLALALFAAGCGDDEPLAVDGDGYSFEAPAGWKEGDANALGEAVGGAPVADAVDTFIAGDVTDEFAENFNVIIQTNVPTGLSVEAWSRQNAAYLARPGIGTQLFPEAESFEPPSGPPKRIGLGGEEAYELEYAATSADGEIHFRVVLALHEGKGYIGTLSSPESPEETEEAFSAIVDSWEFD